MHAEQMDVDICSSILAAISFLPCNLNEWMTNGRVASTMTLNTDFKFMSEKPLTHTASAGMLIRASIASFRVLLNDSSSSCAEMLSRKEKGGSQGTPKTHFQNPSHFGLESKLNATPSFYDGAWRLLLKLNLLFGFDWCKILVDTLARTEWFGLCYVKRWLIRRFQSFTQSTWFLRIRSCIVVVILN